MIKKVGTLSDGAYELEQAMMERVKFWRDLREYHKKNEGTTDGSEFEFNSGIAHSVRNFVRNINWLCKDSEQNIRVVIEKA